MKDRTNITAIILAAGQSSRMGTVKQLLPWRDSTLIEHCIEQARLSKAHNTIVVLGANREKIIPRIYQISGIDLVENTNWNLGMLSSIQAGLKACIENCEAAIILLADQPSIDSKYINELINEYRSSDKSIVATEYQQNIGVPVLFHSSHFSKLFQLTNDSGGAKKYILNNQDITVTVEPNFELYDIDTEADYQRYFKLYS